MSKFDGGLSWFPGKTGARSSGSSRVWSIHAEQRTECIPPRRKVAVVVDPSCRPRAPTALKLWTTIIEGYPWPRQPGAHPPGPEQLPGSFPDIPRLVTADAPTVAPDRSHSNEG